jgi:NAD-dependent deacetylase
MLFQHQDPAPVKKLAALIEQSQHIYAITGAGISTAAGILDLKHLAGRTSMTLSSESALLADPQGFYKGFHQIFIDPIFNNGPTKAHKALAKLEQAGKLSGVVTTNVDCLHELAGSRQVANIWYSLNTNYCLKCGRSYDLQILRQPVPTCPACGGLISPGPVHHHIGIDEQAYEKANGWMEAADLVLVIGSNGYYSNVTRDCVVANINNARNDFDQRADLTLRGTADQVLTQTLTELGL